MKMTPCFVFVALLAAHALAVEPPGQISAETFWWQEKMGTLRNIAVGTTVVTAELAGQHGYGPVWVHRCEFDDPQAKTAGYRKALHQLVTVMEYNKDFPALVEGYRTKLRAMTGLALETQAEWRAWLEENEVYLVWSDRSEQFIIDTEGKSVGVPTEEYRKSHPWTQKP